MPRRLKRRSEGQPEASPPRSPVRRRHNEEEESQSEHESEDLSEEEIPAAEDGETSTSGAPLQQMIKKLVRLALATEFSRQPLRRSDILTKVLDPHNRSFKAVFTGAQKALRTTFGMQLVELPSKEKVTLAQKRAAQRAGGSQSSQASKTWVLTTTLPSHLRSAAILPPARNPSAASEAEYIGLYSFVVSAIYLSQGARLSEGKLERYLARLQAAEYVPGGSKTEDALKRMEKQGYIVRVREREPGGEETVDWILGPRGKIEIGEKGVAGLVKTVYGVENDADLVELEDRLERNLGVGTFKRKGRVRGQNAEEEEAEAAAEEQAADEDDEGARDRSVTVGRITNGRRSRMIDDAAEDDDEEEDDEEEDDDDEEEEDEEEDSQ